MQMENITFNDLPSAFAQFYIKLQNVERLLLQKSSYQEPIAEDLLTVKDAARFLSLAVPTIYTLISKGSIPCMKRSKRVYFSKTDLINYLKEGKKKTSSEINSEADLFLTTYKKKGGKRA